MAIAGLIGGAISLAGVAVSLDAALDESKQQQRYYDVSKQIVQVQQQENLERKKAMEYSARRQEMENLRNGQKAIAAATNFAANSGGLFGSSVKGARGSADAQVAFGSQGISQAVQTGRAMYGLSEQQTAFQMQQADIMSNIASDKGQEAIGNALISGGSALGRMFTD
jgi:hypothetical protein